VHHTIPLVLTNNIVNIFYIEIEENIPGLLSSGPRVIRNTAFLKRTGQD
jgi:hypothetical protein